MFATREKCAVAMDLMKDKWRMETSFEVAKRSQRFIKPIVISKEEAPVKEIVKIGDEVDLTELPVLTHHEMDGYPYLVDAVIAPDPDTGIYNSSHRRMLIRGKDELKHIIVVDKDIDVFNEKEVLCAMATRVQATEDVDIIKGVRGGSLDPSSIIHAVGDKMIIDATKPVSRPYPERIKVPDDVMNRQSSL
ncbi:MAG: hypothetical protein PWQ37_246 [Candidatus Petromonas sp.]|jgi:3-polyprenyl-4-hydroxybenzoate decarboxylase|nr:hypothetical protein [Candidatus Petromonas sp.]